MYWSWSDIRLDLNILPANETVDLALLATHNCEPISSLHGKNFILAASVDPQAGYCALDNIAYECIGVPYI
jgi:hypothetical protein